MGFFRNNSKLLSLSFAVLLASLAGSGMVTWIGASYEEEMASQSIYLWIALAPVCSLLMATGFLPSTVVALFTGYFLGWEGLFFIIPVYLLGSLGSYFFTKRIDKGKLASSLKNTPSAAEILEGIQKNEGAMVFLARLSPSLPFALMNILLAGAGIRFINYLVAGLLGMLPRTVLAVYIAGFAQELRVLLQQGGTVSWQGYLVLFLFVFSFAGMIFILRHSLRAVISSGR